MRKLSQLGRFRFAIDNIVGLHRDNLTLLSNIRTITGYLYVEGPFPSGVQDLSFLRNLRVIQGQELTA